MGVWVCCGVVGVCVMCELLGCDVMMMCDGMVMIGDGGVGDCGGGVCVCECCGVGVRGV